MKVKLSATIPVVQYGNIMPELEAEADTYEEAMAIAEAQIKEIWNRYAEPGKKLDGGDRQLIECFVGGNIYYDDVAHTYTNEMGEKYLSGSEYATSFKEPFDIERIAGAVAKKIEADPNEVIAMWKLKSDISKDFGNALHKAMELYEKYNGLATKLEKTTHLHDHPVIQSAVETFFEEHKDEQAVSEASIVDHSAKRAGRVDRLLIVDEKKKICRIQDYKTNANIEKELEGYWKQLEFYAGIMETNGWTVTGNDIFWWNGVWETFSKENERAAN